MPWTERNKGLSPIQTPSVVADEELLLALGARVATEHRQHFDQFEERTAALRATNHCISYGKSESVVGPDENDDVALVAEVRGVVHLIRLETEFFEVALWTLVLTGRHSNPPPAVVIRRIINLWLKDIYCDKVTYH